MVKKPCFWPSTPKYFKKMVQVLESTADTEHVQPSYCGLMLRMKKVSML
jgi:hypothetical protein